MRVPPFEKFTRAMQLIGVLLIGFIIGALIYHSLYVVQMDNLVNNRIELLAKIRQYEDDIKQLNQYKNQHTVIKSITPRIENEAGSQSQRPHLDKVTEAEIIKRLREDLSSFLGQSIYEIDSNAQFARKLLERKVYNDVYEKDYVVEIKTVLVVDNVLHVWITVRTYIKPPSS
ncbi:hypothetical protein [Paenibacillus sp. IITD108]|uniref:hypothetical protein n=1 Tax=Paenibacillus sp. IITD108 TaxID=3116649 RepID=UPI002F42C900